MKEAWLHRSIGSFAACICTPLLYAYLSVNGPEWIRPDQDQFRNSPLCAFCVLLALGSVVLGVFCVFKMNDSSDEES